MDIQFLKRLDSMAIKTLEKEGKWKDNEQSFHSLVLYDSKTKECAFVIKTPDGTLVFDPECIPDVIETMTNAYNEFKIMKEQRGILQ